MYVNIKYSRNYYNYLKAEIQTIRLYTEHALLMYNKLGVSLTTTSTGNYTIMCMTKTWPRTICNHQMAQANDQETAINEITADMNMVAVTQDSQAEQGFTW